MLRRPRPAVSTKRTLLTSFFVDVSDLLLNLIVAIVTGSVVMIAETLQGLADLTSVGFLLIGHKRSNKASSKLHPFGYGKEIYFWSLLASFLIITITASMSIYLGIQQVRSPEAISDIWLAFTVLTIGLMTNCYAFSVSAARLRSDRSLGNLWRTFTSSQDVAPKTTFVLDLMGASASGLGLIALIVYQLTGNERFDGLGAIAIGSVMAILAFSLLIGLKDLVTGRRAPIGTEQRIRNAAVSHPSVEEILDLKTMMLGPDKILVNIELHMRADLTTNALEEDIDEIKELILSRVPSAFHIQVELETPDREVKKNSGRSRSSTN